MSAGTTPKIPLMQAFVASAALLPPPLSDTFPLMATIGFSYGSFGDITESIKIVVNIVSFIHNGGSAPKEWKVMEEELKLLVTGLASLQSKLPPKLHQDVAGRVITEARLCKEILSRFEAKMPAVPKGRFPRLQDLSKVIFQAKELEAIRQRLCFRREALNEVIGLIAREEARLANERIEKGVSGVADQVIHQGQTLFGAIAGIEYRLEEVGGHLQLGYEQIQTGVKLAELESKLLKWLQFSPDVLNKHATTVVLRYKNTGGWLFDCQEFIDWEGKPGSLWIQGQSGTGKTVLSSTMITKLFKERVAPGIAVGYFYFDFTEQTHAVHKMLRTIILQLSAQTSQPYEALEKLYKSSNSKGQTLPTDAELENVLEELLLEFNRTYIVLDALDECQPDTELDKLLDLISKLRAWNQSPLHLFVTSQSRDMFTSRFENVPCIFLDREAILDDIKLFVSSEIKENRRFHRWAAHASEMIDKVVGKSSGMFRLAACLLVELSRCKHQRELDATLENLPDDLFSVYDRFMGAVDPKYHIYVTGVVRWLLFSASDTGTLTELADAVAFDFSNPSHHTYDPSLLDENEIAIPEWLEGLVAIHTSVQTGERYITLAHASVRDYMLSDRFTKKFNHNLSESSSHLFLGRSCLGRLLYFADHPELPLFSVDLDDIPNLYWVQDVIHPYRLAIYAAENWYYHFRDCGNQAALIPDVQRLLEEGSPQYRALYHLRSYDRDVPSVLYGCSEAGYVDIIPVVLANGADINQRGGKHGTALSAASCGGAIRAMHLLLEHGADPNARNAEGAIVLHTACQRNYGEDIVRILLDHGADINALDAEGRTPLHCASDFQRSPWRDPVESELIIRLLLERGANIDSQDTEGRTVLHTASRREDSEFIVKIMLEHEANVNAQDTKGRTALYHASKQGNIQIFLSLLGHGADVTISGGRCGSVLHAAAASNYETTEIISILLEKGADVNSRGGRYGNPLQAACRSGAEISAIQLLLRHGADVNAQGGKYGTALRAASLFAPTSVVELLMEHGADVEPHGTAGSALELASSCGNMDTVRLLLKKSALLSEEPREDRPAFHIVAALDNAEMCRLFLERCPSREVVQLLTERGVAEFSDTDLSDASDEMDGSVETDGSVATDVSNSSEEKDGILENETGGSHSFDSADSVTLL